MIQRLAKIRFDQILIAPTHLHNDIRRRLLTQAEHPAHMTILSLAAFLQRKQEEVIDPDTVLYQYREQLADFNTRIYRSIYRSRDFIQQCYHLIEIMKLYGITPEELPSEDEAQRERRAIISRLYPIPINQDQENHVLTLWKANDCARVRILANVYSAMDLKRIEYLCAAGAEWITLPTQEPAITYYHSVNKRKEIEAAAQLIIERGWHASDVQIIACDPYYPPLIHQVFARYHIPHTLPPQARISLLSVKAQTLLAYAVEPCMKNIIALLEAEAVTVPYAKDWIDYVKLFGKREQDAFDHIHRKAKPSQLIGQAEIDRLLERERRAQECRQALQEILADLASWTDVRALLQRIGELLLKQTHDRQEIQALADIQQAFQCALPYLHDRDDLMFLRECLTQIHDHEGAHELGGAVISTLQKPPLPEHTVLVFGCTQDHYPAFPLHQGIFDEAYFALLPHYPTLNQRHHAYQQQCEALLMAYETLIVAYPLGNYEGKANESSLEMETLIQKKPEFYAPREIVRTHQACDHIPASQARDLYLKAGILHGSVSSFERYQQCPFAYFLMYGLAIDEPDDDHFSISRIGTLTHHLLETLVKRDGKAYSQATRKEIEALLGEELRAVSDVYPRLTPSLSLIKRRLADSLISRLQDLCEREQHSQLTPAACEAEFYWELPQEAGYRLRLHGFIDRIDANDRALCIVDYKSSRKTMSAKRFAAGLQLQLVTYALYARQQWHKQVLGAFYYSLKQENIPAPAGKMKRRPVAYVPYDESDWEAMRLREQRLQGWFMDPEIELIDDTGSFIQGSRINKDGMVTARKIYSLDQLSEWTLTMYQMIAEQILAGDIRCEPVEDACLFCHYHDICRFHGYPRALTSLVEMEGEVKEDGAME